LGRTRIVIASVSEAILESLGARRLLDRHVASLLAMTIPAERILKGYGFSLASRNDGLLRFHPRPPL
jgi:hypothetical protein